MATKHAARDLAQLSGHSEADCRDVLAQCDGDIDRAVDKLLNSAYRARAVTRRNATQTTTHLSRRSPRNRVVVASAPTFLASEGGCRNFLAGVGGVFF